jgi:drug/metabolite transporter (DMT)-like permease
MNSAATTLWLLCMFIDALGQMSFKAAATKVSNAEGLKRWQEMLSNFWIWIGIGCYIFEFFIWMAFLSMVPLAQGVLLSCLNIMTVMIGGRIFFGEKLTNKRILSASLIAIGVALVGWGS